MRSKGVSAEAIEVSDFRELSHNAPSLFDMIDEYRESLCEYIINYSGADGGGLLSALLLGERDYLPFQSKLSFKRCGLSHMLALSGLHLTIITFAISYVLSLLKIRKKPRKVIEIIFVILYSMLTGMPISVVRAALMHIIASLIFLMAAKSDSITSLSISVVIILCVMPYAIYDVSLWLSAFATLGVLIYSEVFRSKYNDKNTSLAKRILYGFVGGITVSLFAIGATYLISILSFGEISLIGALATPIATFFITPFMYLGLLYLLFAWLIPLGIAVNAYGTFICNLIQVLSSISGIYISADDMVTVLLVSLFTVAVILFLILDINKKKYPLVILLAIYILSNVSALTANIINRSSDDLIYFCDSSDEYFLIKSQNAAHFIDVSSSSVSDNYSAIEHISDDGITEIKNYVFVSYNDNTVASALRLASSIYIQNIYLPHPESETEVSIYKTITRELRGSYTKLNEYSTGNVIELGLYKAIFPLRSRFENKCAFFIIDPTYYVTCYTSSGMLNENTKVVASEMISKCDRLILGRHGESYLNFKFITKFSNLDEIVVSSKNLTIPNEMLGYYKNATIRSSSDRMSLKR
jgi:competence protein ComEC